MYVCRLLLCDYCCVVPRTLKFRFNEYYQLDNVS